MRFNSEDNACAYDKNHIFAAGGFNGSTRMRSAEGYVIKNGITLQSTAPYVSDSTSPPTSGVCKTTYSPQIKPIKDQWDFTNDVAGTMNYIATISPVAVALVVCADFNFYKSGIYNNASCNEQNSEGGHAMTMIGYGTENGVDYWLCRNSWGPTWGESGHVRIKRGANIATIESRGIYAPVPITAANKCTTSLDYYYDSYPNCQCTAAKTTAPSAPFTVQSQPGQTGCIPSKIQYNCTGSGKDVVGVTLYDDSGKQIGGEMNYCYSKRSTDAPVVKCMTIPSGSSVNYGTYENSRVAYAVCQNWGPQGADWGC
ncbi:unnamed protein product, partial [Mesorhabditis belari]|uniref:Peptidase C1A papain C-terminal domain-containing protein n=1 Tax=Mesorhabditis belari TaxID=2138241 RepID=A0AAF3F489_9BILA